MSDVAEANPAGNFNPFDLNAPHALWEQLRKEQPVFRHDETGYARQSTDYFYPATA